MQTGRRISTIFRRPKPAHSDLPVRLRFLRFHKDLFHYGNLSKIISFRDHFYSNLEAESQLQINAAVSRRLRAAAASSKTARARKGLSEERRIEIADRDSFVRVIKQILNIGGKCQIVTTSGSFVSGSTPPPLRPPPPPRPPRPPCVP
jgi:hypothetical protein